MWRRSSTHTTRQGWSAAWEGGYARGGGALLAAVAGRGARPAPPLPSQPLPATTQPETRGLDWEGMCNTLSKAPRGSAVLLHACAHNPTGTVGGMAGRARPARGACMLAAFSPTGLTRPPLRRCAAGVDPSVAQWRELSQLFKERTLFPFFDSAYQVWRAGEGLRWRLRRTCAAPATLPSAAAPPPAPPCLMPPPPRLQGFASGDCDRDAAAVRIFVDDGHKVSLSQVGGREAVGQRGQRRGRGERGLGVRARDLASRSPRCYPLVLFTPQSFAKNMGMYGQRVGCWSIVCEDAAEAKAVESQMKVGVRWGW